MAQVFQTIPPPQAALLQQGKMEIEENSSGGARRDQKWRKFWRDWRGERILEVGTPQISSLPPAGFVPCWERQRFDRKVL